MAETESKMRRTGHRRYYCCCCCWDSTLLGEVAVEMHVVDRGPVADGPDVDTAVRVPGYDCRWDGPQIAAIERRQKKTVSQLTNGSLWCPAFLPRGFVLFLLCTLEILKKNWLGSAGKKRKEQKQTETRTIGRGVEGMGRAGKRKEEGEERRGETNDKDDDDDDGDDEKDEDQDKSRIMDPRMAPWFGDGYKTATAVRSGGVVT